MNAKISLFVLKRSYIRYYIICMTLPLNKFPNKAESFKYFFFQFWVSESKSLENSMDEAKSAKPFKSTLMQLFTLV